jgi:hypothetical protein
VTEERKLAFGALSNKGLAIVGCKAVVSVRRRSQTFRQQSLVIWDLPPLCWACAVLMRLRQLSLCRHINKATARPEGSKIDCSADDSHEGDSGNGGFVKDFALVGAAIGWLAQGNLNRCAGNPIQT